MKYVGNLLIFSFITVLLIAGCGLLGSDDENGTEENFEEISLEDLPGTLVFSARADDGNFQIFTMKPDGTELTQLTFREMEPLGESSSRFNGYEPSWSPDGEQIVFTTEYQSTTLGFAIWIMNADGSGLRPMHIPYPEDHPTLALWGNNPRWSPDGRKIAFWQCSSCSVSTNHVIYVFDLETEQTTRLTEEPLGYRSNYPYWSPDGNRLAFISNRDYVDADTLRYRQDLYVMDADGSNQTRITTTGNATRPAWSPDGNMIAYEWQIRENSIFIYLFNSDQIINVDSELEFSGNPMWNDKSNILLLSGRKNKYSSAEMRLLGLNPHDGTHKVLDSLNLKTVWLEIDWFIPLNNK